MINKSCVKCHQSMNGGVYRKPNMCPHCLTLQDPAFDARMRPLTTMATVKTMAKAPQMVAMAPAAMEVEEIFAHDESEVLQAMTGEPLGESLSITAIQPPLAASSPFEAAAARETDTVAEAPVQAEPIVEEAAVAAAPEAADTETETAVYAELEDVVVAAPAANSAVINEDELLFDDYHGYDELCGTVEVQESLAAELSVAAGDTNVRNIAAKLSDNRASHARVGGEIHDSFGIALEAPHKRAASGDDYAKVTSFRSKKGNGGEASYEQVVLTTETARDIKVAKLLDVVTAECVFETSMVHSDFNPSKKAQGSMNVLKDARKTVLDTLKKEAFTLGANSVIGLNLSYSEISRGKTAMMLVTATGTAVRAEVSV